MMPNPAMHAPARSLRTTANEGGHADPVLIGADGALRPVMRQIDLAAPTAVTVLLLGETGTGKGLLAQIIHRRSPRANRPFVVVDCGALPPTLIESELFGRERGAFTGADSAQPGRFEVANGGTVFLDEIGELPLELQSKLLRVLQEGYVERLGTTRATRVDVRIIAATNRDLGAEVRDGRFRRDLFYRLNVFPITVPSLRHRREDLPEMVGHLISRLSRELGRPVRHIDPAGIQALARYDWPGNIRELENVLQRGIIMSRNGVIDLTDFIHELGPSPAVAVPSSNGLQSLAETERNHMRSVLERMGWRIEGPAGAARVLGLQPSTLRSKMRHLGLFRPESYRRLKHENDAHAVGCSSA
jgi:transcriptional regulator with GAF, ATPase, and Fis domain